MGAPLGKLHVRSALVSGATVDADADDLVVENSGSVGMTLLGGDSVIEFVSGTQAQRAAIKYDGSARRMTIGPTGGTQAESATLTIRSGADGQALRFANGGVATFASRVPVPRIEATEYVQISTPSTPGPSETALIGVIKWDLTGIYINVDGETTWEKVSFDV